VILDALIGEAEIRMTQGDAQIAFPLLWAVRDHPSSSHATRSRVKTLCSELESRLPSQGVTMMPDSRDHTINAFVDEILHSRNP
jgi:hypothetical protein